LQLRSGSDGDALWHAAVGDPRARGGGQELVGQAGAHLEVQPLVAGADLLLHSLDLCHKLGVLLLGRRVLGGTGEGDSAGPLLSLLPGCKLGKSGWARVSGTLEELEKQEWVARGAEGGCAQWGRMVQRQGVREIATLLHLGMKGQEGSAQEWMRRKLSRNSQVGKLQKQ
jgi:hypothetical protein